MTRLWILLCLQILLVTAAVAGPGHDHGDDHSPAAAGAIVPRVESVGTEFELVATAEGHKLTIYLDRAANNEPVSGATIELSADGVAAVANPIGEGTYEIEGEWIDVPGTKALVFTITAGDTIDLLNGTLEIRAAAGDKADAPSAGSRLLLADPLVWGLVGAAALIGFLLALGSRFLRLPPDGAARGDEGVTTDKGGLKIVRHAAEAIVLVSVLAAVDPGGAWAGPGHNHGGPGEAPATASGNVPQRLPDGSVFVPKPSQRLLQVRTRSAVFETAPRARELIGMVISDPSSAGHVQAPMDGQIGLSERGIAYVGQMVKAGEVLARLSPTIPIADLGTMQQLRAEVEGKLKVAEQKLARLTRIASVVAQSEIEDTRAEFDALREQRRVLAPKDVEQIELKAPVSGIISAASVRAGQVVTARDTLFEIVDPDKIWIEAIDTDGHGLESLAAAHALDGEGHSIALGFIGRSPTLRQQSQPLLFRIEAPHAGLSIGATVKVIVQTAATEKGVVLPDAAVVRGPNGLPQVWTKSSPERFRPVLVRTLPLDGSRVLVVAGIEDGSRVVTVGAELINQIR